MGKKNDLYVSYKREEKSCSFIKRLIKQNHYQQNIECYHAQLTNGNLIKGQLCGNSSTCVTDPLDEFIINYDEKLQPGELIPAFMRDLILGDHIVFIVSELYFQSVFCMYELSEACQERGGSLLPVLVDVDDCCKTFKEQGKINDLVNFWKKKAEDSSNTNGVFKYRCNMIAEALPLLLSWLIPPVDLPTGTIIHKNIISESDQDACQKVFDQCAKEYKPLYMWVSPRQRDQAFAKEISQVQTELEKKGLDEGFKGALHIKATLMEAGLRHKISDNNPIAVLDELSRWLDSIKEDNKVLTENKKKACEQAIILLGWLLVYAIDLEKLLFLVCELNHLEKNACIYMENEADIVLQLIVAALHNIKAEYRFEKKDAGGRKIIGKGELVASESGISLENFVNRVKDELSWIDPQKLHNKVTWIRDGEEPDRNSMSSDQASKALGYLFGNQINSKLKKLYLNLDLTGGTSLENVQLMSEQIRKICPQINICLTKEPEKKEKNYFWKFENFAVKGVDAGVLSTQIREIFSTIKKISDGDLP